MLRLSRGINNETKKKRKNIRERAEKVKFLSNLLQERKISSDEFLDAMAEKNIFPKNENI